jgi:hypothetical protein
MRIDMFCGLSCNSESKQHLLYKSSIGHGAYNTTRPSRLCQLKSRSAFELPNATWKLTFSCQPSKTLPLMSPHPGMAIPLYRYFISVSCASWLSDLITDGISVALVVLSIVRSVCSVNSYGKGGLDI